MGERPCCKKSTFKFLCMISYSLNQRFLFLKRLNVKYLTFKRMEPLRSDLSSGNSKLGRWRFTYWCILGSGKAWLGREAAAVFYSLLSSQLLLRLKCWTQWLFCSVCYCHTSVHPCACKKNGFLTFSWQYKVNSTSFFPHSLLFSSPLAHSLNNGMHYLWSG